MNDESHQSGSVLFLTVDAVLAEHEHLLAAQSAQEDLSQVQSFVDALTRSGAYFDEPLERKALQGTLDYWTSELARHQTDEEPAGQRRRAIQEFNAEALQALQRDFDNPFAHISDAINALKPEERNSATILRVVTETAQAGRLRFQEGLLKELVSQLTASREDTTLLEFCLWHLFEDAQTRTGNKIYRPKRSGNQAERVEFFSCKVFLIRKADELVGTLPEAQRDALIEALMNIGDSSSKAPRSRSLFRSITAEVGDITEFVKEQVLSTSADDLQFALYDKQPLTLAEFLERSRLAFWRDGKWSIVHPALADRWDPLKKLSWDLEQRQKRARTRLVVGATSLLVAVVTSVAWWAWDRVWANSTLNHLARAQGASSNKERLSESVQALFASKFSIEVDKLYVSQVANDAIGSVIGENARSGNLGRLPSYPSIPDIECERIQLFGGANSYSVTLGSDFGPPITLQRSVACPIFATNLKGTLLAAAWEKRGGVSIKVFDLSPDFRLGSGKDGDLVEADLMEEDAPWMKTAPLKLTHLLREESKKRGETPCKDRSLRFSQGDRIVTFECLYTSASDSNKNELEWLPLAVDSGSSGPAHSVPNNTFDVLQKLGELEQASSIFLSSRSEPKLGFVTVKGDGHVQIWHEAKDHPSQVAEDRSDFVRVGTSGRPAALDVQDASASPLYAIYARIPYPVIRVYEQRDAKHATLLMEHYPPGGVGKPIGMRFMPKARCLQILGKRHKGDGLVLVDYYLILDPDRLRIVGEALSKDLAADPPTPGLPQYKKAIDEQCGTGA
jgi:hypothetical protein